MTEASFVVEQLIYVKGTVPWNTYMVKRKMMFTCQKNKIKVKCRAKLTSKQWPALARIVIRVFFSSYFIYFMASCIKCWKNAGFFVFKNQGWVNFEIRVTFSFQILPPKLEESARCRQNCMVTKYQRTSIPHCHEQFLLAPEEKMKQTQTPLIGNRSMMYQVRTVFWHNLWRGV